MPCADKGLKLRCFCCKLVKNLSGKPKFLLFHMASRKLKGFQACAELRSTFPNMKKIHGARCLILFFMPPLRTLPCP